MDPRLGCSPLALVSATTRECQLGISGWMDPQLGGSPLALDFATTWECQLGISGGMDPRLGVLLSLPSPQPLRSANWAFREGWIPDLGVLLSLPSPRPLRSANWAFWEDGSPIGGFSSRSRLCDHLGVPIGHFGRMDPQLGGSPLTPVSATTRECQLGILGGWIPDWGVLLLLPSPQPLGSANWAFQEGWIPIGGFSSHSHLRDHLGVPIR